MLNDTHHEGKMDNQGNSTHTVRSADSTVEWPSACFRGGSRPTHKLVTVSPDILEFRQTSVTILGGVLFLLFGVGVLGLSAFKHSEGTHWIGVILLCLMGLLFLIIGSGLLIGRKFIVVFDKRNGVCRHGMRTYYKNTKGSVPPCQVKIDDIKAIELVPRHYWSSSGDSGSSEILYAFELVLNDGKRIKVLNYSKCQDILDDGRSIAAFIDKPLWDLTSTRANDSD